MTTRFLISGDPAQHGGPDVEPPVLVYDVADIQVFIPMRPGIVPLMYSTEAEAAAVAARIMRRTQVCEVELIEDGWILISRKLHEGRRL